MNAIINSDSDCNCINDGSCNGTNDDSNCCGYLAVGASGEQICVLNTNYDNVSYASTYSQGTDPSGCDGSCCTTLTFQFLYSGKEKDNDIHKDFYVNNVTYVNCNSWETTCYDNSQSTDPSGWKYEDDAWILEVTIPNVCLSKTLTQYQEPNTNESPIDAAATVYMSYKDHDDSSVYGNALIYITPMDADLSNGVCTANGEWRTANKTGSGASDYNHVITQNQWPGNQYNQQSEAKSWTFRWKVDSCTQSNNCQLLDDVSIQECDDCWPYCSKAIPSDSDVYEASQSCTSLEIKCT